MGNKLALYNASGNNHFDYVDVLRGLAILGVVAVHSQHGTFDGPQLLQTVINNGRLGVQLFYLASAFTLFLSFKTRLLQERFPVRNFFIRRFFRIAPMFYLAIIGYYFGWDNSEITWANILAHFTFLHGFFPSWINTLVPGGWSVADEMIFYALMPLIIYRVTTITKAANLLLVLILFFPLISILAKYTPPGYWYFCFLTQLPIFCLGIITYFIIIENKRVQEVPKRTLWLLGFFILGQVCVWRYLRHVLPGIGFVLLSVALSRGKFKILINPIFIYLGKISYSMYIIHFGVFTVLEKIHFIDYVNNGIANYVIRFAIVTIITASISTISYHLIEKPFQKLSKKIIKRLEG